MSTPRQKHIAVLQMLACAALWSIAGIFIKLIPWNSFVIAGLRSLVAGLVVFAYMRLKGMHMVVTRRTVIPAVFMAGLFFCFVGANKLTTAANAIALQYTAPLFLMLFSAVVLHERLRKADVIASVVTFAGVVLFFLDQLGPGRVAGNLVAILSGVFFALMLTGAYDSSNSAGRFFPAGSHAATAAIASIKITTRLFIRTKLQKSLSVPKRTERL